MINLVCRMYNSACTIGVCMGVIILLISVEMVAFIFSLNAKRKQHTKTTSKYIKDNTSENEKKTIVDKKDDNDLYIVDLL